MTPASTALERLNTTARMIANSIPNVKPMIESTRVWLTSGPICARCAAESSPTNRKVQTSSGPFATKGEMPVKLTTICQSRITTMKVIAALPRERPSVRRRARRRSAFRRSCAAASAASTSLPVGAAGGWAVSTILSVMMSSPKPRASRIGRAVRRGRMRPERRPRTAGTRPRLLPSRAGPGGG